MPWAGLSESFRPPVRGPICSYGYPWRSKMPIRIVLADNHVLVCQSLKSLLEREGMQVIGEAHDGQQAIGLIEKLHPDIAVMDIGMPVLNGLDAAREAHRTSPKTKVILL